MNMGMGLLPDDRKAEGIIGDLSVRENIILALQAKRGMFKQLPRAKQEEIADRYIDLLQIKTASRETPIKQLSGGNQQRPFWPGGWQQIRLPDPGRAHPRYRHRYQDGDPETHRPAGQRGQERDVHLL